MVDPIDAVYSLPEELPESHEGLFCAACAEFLLPLYRAYDLEGKKFQLLRDQLDLIWKKIANPLITTAQCMSPEALSDQTVPDVDTDKSENAIIAQASSTSVVNACQFSRSGKADCVRYACEQVELAINVLGESKDDEAAYSRALISLRGLPPEEVGERLKVLNKKTPSSKAAKRVASATEEFCSSVKTIALLSDVTGSERIVPFAKRIATLAVSLLG